MPVTINPTNIVFNDGTTQSTAAAGGGGTVTSVATGNGLSGGTITTSGTLTLACPGANTVGSWGLGFIISSGSVVFGSNYAAGGGYNQFQLAVTTCWDEGNPISGTWRWFGRSANPGGGFNAGNCLACRVS